jgi:hypothetical protein
MVDADFLYAVAQVGATYAGFSTLVAIVAYRGQTGPIPARIYYMLLLSLIVIMSSFLPQIVQYFGADNMLAWRIASALYAAAWTGFWISALRTIKTRLKSHSELSFLNRLNTYAIHPAAIAVLSLGAFGLWGDLAGAVYATALFVMLYMSAYLFLQIVTGFLRDRESQ